MAIQQQKEHKKDGTYHITEVQQKTKIKKKTVLHTKFNVVRAWIFFCCCSNLVVHTHAVHIYFSYRKFYIILQIFDKKTEEFGEKIKRTINQLSNLLAMPFSPRLLRRVCALWLDAMIEIDFIFRHKNIFNLSVQNMN